MAQDEFRALIVEESTAQTFSRRIGTRRIAALPPGELLLRVAYSSLNYKDALSACGRPGVTRRYPHTPGIDAAGTVVTCSDGRFAPGQEVLVTGFDLGMNTPGGFGEYIRVPSAWGVALPAGLTLRESMILGTAGFTAALCVQRLVEAGVTPRQGEVLVTGASGGVGSLAVALLAKAGYPVTAASGKGEPDYLRHLGAAEVLGRAELLQGAERPLLKERWAGAVDVVGGATLAAVVKATRYGGAVTCCGLVGSADLPLNVFPFILRGVSLHGIDSVQCPPVPRQQTWAQLAGAWHLDCLEELATECMLEELEPHIQAILAGTQRGRVLVRIAP